MTSSQGDKKSCDVEMGDASLRASSSNLTLPGAMLAYVAGFFYCQDKLARREAEKELGPTCTEPSRFPAPTGDSIPEVKMQPSHDVVPHGGASAILVLVPEASAQPSGSSTTLVPVDEIKQTRESMPPPPMD